MPSRRAVLATALVASTSGCLQLLCPYGTRVRAGPFTPEDAVLDPSGDRADLADAAIEDGTATATLAGAAPFEDGDVVVRDDAYYRLSLESRDGESVPALVVDVDWERDRRPPDGTAPLAYSDLPEPDRAAVEYAVYGHAYDETGHPEETLRVRGTAVPYPDGLEDSVLADRDEVWVEMDDRAYRIAVRGEDTRERYTYEYAATEVATDLEEFRDWVASDRLVELNDLPEAEASIVEQAIDDVYRECRDPSDRLVSLQERVTGASGQDATGEWYVGYEGERYTLEFASFATG